MSKKAKIELTTEQREDIKLVGGIEERMNDTLLNPKAHEGFMAAKASFEKASSSKEILSSLGALAKTVEKLGGLLEETPPRPINTSLSDEEQKKAAIADHDPELLSAGFSAIAESISKVKEGKATNFDELKKAAGALFAATENEGNAFGSYLGGRVAPDQVKGTHDQGVVPYHRDAESGVKVAQDYAEKHPPEVSFFASVTKFFSKVINAVADAFGVKLSPKEAEKTETMRRNSSASSVDLEPEQEQKQGKGNMAAALAEVRSQGISKSLQGVSGGGKDGPTNAISAEAQAAQQEGQAR